MRLIAVSILVLALFAAGCGGSSQPAEPEVFATASQVESLIREQEMSGPLGQLWGDGRQGKFTVSCVSKDDVGRAFSCYSQVELAYSPQALQIADYEVVCDDRRCQWDRYGR